MLEGSAVLSLSQYWCQDPSASGYLDLHSAKTSCSQATVQTREAVETLKTFLPLPYSSPSPLFPCCYVDAVVIAVCVLKGFYIKYLVGLKIKSTSSRLFLLLSPLG